MSPYCRWARWPREGSTHRGRKGWNHTTDYRPLYQQKCSLNDWWTSFYRQIGQQFTSHSTVIHSKGEYSRGRVHCNSSESFASLFERARFGVFHYMSKKHLQRYLHEFVFRWEHRVSYIKKTKAGKTKRVMRPIPIIDMLILLIMGISGCHLKRTPQWSLNDVAFVKP